MSNIKMGKPVRSWASVYAWKFKTGDGMHFRSKWSEISWRNFILKLEWYKTLNLSAPCNYSFILFLPNYSDHLVSKLNILTAKYANKIPTQLSIQCMHPLTCYYITLPPALIAFDVIINYVEHFSFVTLITNLSNFSNIHKNCCRTI